MKFLRGIAYIFFVGFVVLCLMEIAYRYQWIDFYKTEFQALNKDMPDNCDKRVLVFGDSFSAQHESYVNQLKQDMPGICIYNAAVPGTGIVQTQIMAKKRLSQVRPNLVIYQMYLGNDLIDIHHPINWTELGPGRNLYWWLSDRFRVIGFMNQRLGQLSHTLTTDINKGKNSKDDPEFSVERYSERTKLFLKADPNYLDKSVRALKSYGRRIEKLCEGVDYLRSALPEGCKLIILPIPHCAQLNEHYLSRYIKLGAKFDHPGKFQEEDYVLINKLESTFEDAQTTVINPLHHLKNQDFKDNRLYYENDPHLNEKGHQVLGDFLEPFIKEAFID